MVQSGLKLQGRYLPTSLPSMIWIMMRPRLRDEGFGVCISQVLESYVNKSRVRDQYVYNEKATPG